ncbi:MAG: isopeptide-forming domain-containing fimbrial protein [Oscillospiraceae bacterium]|nr:isopeptide-forming domain-containing fimbrial protein [Oscillospiraceae bacterium]
MKKMNKFLSLLLAIIMVMSLAVTGFAADGGPYTITIKEAENKDYRYEAFQIFAGELTVDSVSGFTTLSNITWGSGVPADKQASLVAALKLLEVNGDKPFKDCETAADFAVVLGQNTTKDNDVAKAFAEVVGAVHTNGTLLYLANPSPSSVYNADSKTHVLTVQNAGYYLVRNNAIPTFAEDREATHTRYILEVVHNVTVDHKGDVPTVDKDILGYELNADGTPKVDGEGNPIRTRVDANTANVGDIITYELEGTLPTNIDDYDTYYYVFNDLLSAGLTFLPGTGKVTVNGVDVTDYFYPDVSTQADGSTYLRVGIQDLLALELLTQDEEGNPLSVGEITKDTKVIVTYDAILNDNALVGVEGNKNAVELTYSNNPNFDGDGATTPPPPPPGPPTPPPAVGVTPPSEVITYTTELTITKKDDSNRTLTGAAFTISGNSLNRVVTTGDIFVMDNTITENIYYKLADGTYTDKAPVFKDDSATAEVDERTYPNYDQTHIHGNPETDPDHVTVDKFARVPKTTIAYKSTPVSYTAFVDASGVLKLTGLGQGIYTITEVVTPDGYNTIDPFTITITEVLDSDGLPTGEWTYTGTDYVDANNNNKYDEGEVFTNNVTVINVAGATLPSTGGMGTTLFYALGGILVLAAVVLLVSKKRMSAE